MKISLAVWCIIQSMQKKKKLIQSVWLHKLLRIHTVVTVLSLSAYFLVAFFDPGFLSYDLRQKYRVLADDVIVLMATVLGPPVQPVVTGLARCRNNTMTLSNVLDWSDDVNTYTYDIDRDGLLLATGLTASDYIDTNLALDTTYQYKVTANGPMGPGFAASDPVTIATVPDCRNIAPASSVNIAVTSGQTIALDNAVLPSTTDTQPVFSGTSTIPYALVYITLESPIIFTATTIANANGYWSWSPPETLSAETHTLTVRATDPNDASNEEVSSYAFVVVADTDESSDSSSKKSHTKRASATLTPTAVSSSSSSSSAFQALFDFSLSVENSRQEILQGQNVRVVLKISDIPKQYDEATVPIRYSFIDEKGRVIFSTTRDAFLKKGDEIRESLPVPLYTTLGKYSLRAEILLDQANISRMVSLSIVALPLFDLGGGTLITYAGVTRNLGWISLTLLVSLLLWLFMFIREYGMYLHALRHITEKHLGRSGFVPKRKGVVR